MTCSARDSAIRVLVVEDDDRIRLLVERFAEHLGWEVRSFSAAVGLLDHMAGGEEVADLLIVDVAMPGMDGLTLVQRVRETPDWAGTPILAFTGLVMPDERSAILESGCDAYLAKPVRLDEFRTTCESLIERHTRD